jgi:hypothetical protein
MSEQAQLETPLPPARRSKKLVIIATTLAFLPLVLPVPFVGLARLWIEPVYEAKLQACPLRDCSDLLTLDRLSMILILGPSVLAALASILLGIIGLIRMPLRTTAPNDIDTTLMFSVIVGILWLVLLGCVLWLYLTAFIYL